MATPALKEVEPNLTTELQAQFNFAPDPTGKWLQSDEFDHVMIGGIEQYEWLPTRARALADGTRFEIGARKVDLEGLLELAKIVKSTAQGLDKLTKFWQRHPKVGVSVEDEWVFMGVNLEPTTEALSREFSGIGFAYDLAITAAIEGKTRTEMSKDKDTRRWIRHIEEPSGFSGIFGSSETATVEESEQQKEARKVREEKWERETALKNTADTLSDYPIGGILFGVHNAPGKVKFGGTEEREFTNGSWIVMQPGRPDVMNGQKRVEITIPKTYRPFLRLGQKELDDGLTLSIGVPEGVEVNTLGDIRNLTKAEIHTRAKNKKGYTSRAVEIDVTATGDFLRIVTADNSLDFELRTPCCTECQTPTWKFPFREDVMRMDIASRPHEWDDKAFLYGYGVGGGEPPKFTPYFEKDQEKSYCGDCILPVVDRFIEAHPLALRSKAIEVARGKLGEIGYSDVQIWDDQVWRTSSLRRTDKPGWDFFTNLKYQRDGREIIRHTGIPALTDDGEFTPNMLPREYVDFRYK